MTKKPPEKTVRLGDLNGWSTLLLKLFLLSWPVFLASFLALVAFGFQWGSWATTELKISEEFRDRGPRYTPTDAEVGHGHLEDSILSAIIRHNEARNAHKE
jgi:hypothetical protein